MYVSTFKILQICLYSLTTRSEHSRQEANNTDDRLTLTPPSWYHEAEVERKAIKCDIRWGLTSHCKGDTFRKGIKYTK